MKYLKLFEQLDKTFWKLGFDQFLDLRDVEDDEFSSYEAKLIEDWSYKFDYGFTKFGYDRILLKEDEPSIRVRKYYDDWFLIDVTGGDYHGIKKPTRYFKTDQIYGVIDCLNYILTL